MLGCVEGAIASPTVRAAISGKVRLAPASSQLRPGAAVATGTGGQARLSFGIGRITLYPKSLIRVNQLRVTQKGGYFYDFSLRAGKAYMAKGSFLNGTSAAKLTTNGGTYWVKGTRLLLANYGLLDTLVVTEGAVRACYEDLHGDCDNPAGTTGVEVQAGQMLLRDFTSDQVTVAPIVREVSQGDGKIKIWFAPDLEVWQDGQPVTLVKQVGEFATDGQDIELELRFAGQSQGKQATIKINQ